MLVDWLRGARWRAGHRVGEDEVAPQRLNKPRHNSASIADRSCLSPNHYYLQPPPTQLSSKIGAGHLEGPENIVVRKACKLAKCGTWKEVWWVVQTRLLEAFGGGRARHSSHEPLGGCKLPLSCPNVCCCSSTNLQTTQIMQQAKPQKGKTQKNTLQRGSTI